MHRPSWQRSCAALVRRADCSVCVSHSCVFPGLTPPEHRPAAAAPAAGSARSPWRS
jgi:hypothetical protein